MSLARLIADIEIGRRDDILLALVYQPNTPVTPLLTATLAHCSRKFPTEAVESPLGDIGHPKGCTALFAGTASHYYNKWRSGELKHDSIFMLDGGDVVPLHTNWIDIAMSEHDKTVCGGKLITGTPYFIDTCPLHVNPNAIFELSVFGRTKIITDVPKHDGTLATCFDIYHREEMLQNARLTSLVRTDWRGAGRIADLDMLRERSREFVLLHGYKDSNLRWLSREHLVHGTKEPHIRQYSLDLLRQHEVVQRSFEVGW